MIRVLLLSLILLVAVASVITILTSEEPGESQPVIKRPDIQEALVFRSLDEGNSEIYFMRPGGSRIRLTHNEVFDINPSLSPDGTKVVYESQVGPFWRDIIVLDLRNGTETNLTRIPADSPYYDVDPAWSPDGSKIVFVSSRHGAYNYEIYVMNDDGSEQRRLTDNSYPDFWPSWSPDGKTIAFGRYASGTLESAEIFLLDVATGAETRLTDNAVMDARPSWSPDGRRLAFESRRDAIPEIYVMNRNGSGIVRLTNDGAPDSHPDWSPDGTRIVYSSFRGNSPGGRLVTVNSDGSGGETELESVRSGDAPNWGVAVYDPLPAQPPSSSGRPPDAPAGINKPARSAD
jgi:Tol biopolymer transport system component